MAWCVFLAKDPRSAGGTDRRYTGQIESPGLGLYFFNARWVDPWLGRFTQPDTLIPNPGVSQSWDRYAYVNNNPVNRTDPSGHYACDDWDDSGKCTKRYQKKENEKDVLSEGGKRAQEYYQWARSNEGWWNNYSVDTMTIEQFFGLFILFEADGDRNETDGILYWIEEVVGYQLWADTTSGSFGGNSPYCNSSHCQNGLLNFMASYQGANKFPKDNFLINRFAPGRLEINSPRLSENEVKTDLQQEAGRIVVALVMDKSKYQAGDKRTMPYHWGNLNLPGRPFYVTNCSGSIVYYRYPQE